MKGLGQVSDMLGPVLERMMGQAPQLLFSINRCSLAGCISPLSLIITQNRNRRVPQPSESIQSLKKSSLGYSHILASLDLPPLSPPIPPPPHYPSQGPSPMLPLLLLSPSWDQKNCPWCYGLSLTSTSPLLHLLPAQPLSSYHPRCWQACENDLDLSSPI